MAEKIATTNPLEQINSILNLVGGTSSTKVTSPTTQTDVGNLTNDQMTQIIQQILGGTQGLASVAQGQRTAGIYNSTVNSQLVNDLLSRVSTQVAAANAGKTVTTSEKTEKTITPGITGRVSGQDLLGTLGISLAGAALNPLAKKAGGKLTDILSGGSNVADSVSNFVGASPFVDTAASQISSIIGPAEWATGATNVGGALGSGTFDLGLPNGLNLFSSGSGLTDAASSLSDVFDFGGTPVGPAVAAASAISDLAGGDASLGEVAPGLANAGLSYVTGGISTIADAITGGGVSDAVEGVSNGVSDMLSGIGKSAGSIICTELHRQDKLSLRKVIAGAMNFRNYPDWGIAGYYMWAEPTVKYIQKNPDSLFTAFISSVFNARAEYVGAAHGYKGMKKSFKGWLAYRSVDLLCATLGTIFRTGKFCGDKAWLM